MVPLTFTLAVDFNQLCVPLTVKLLNQWSGGDINEAGASNETQLKALAVINSFLKVCWVEFIKAVRRTPPAFLLILTENQKTVSELFVVIVLVFLLVL